MERLLHHCFEIRTAHSNRRRALSGWREEDQDRYGYAILENDGRMVTMHLVRAAEWRRLSRQGERLWRRDE
jgi:hypothetical protein